MTPEFVATSILLMRDAVPRWEARLPLFRRTRRWQKSIILSTIRGLRPGDVLRLSTGEHLELVTVDALLGRRVFLKYALLHNHRRRAPAVRQQAQDLGSTTDWVRQ